MLELWGVLGQPVLAAISQESWGPGIAGSMAHTWPSTLGHPPWPGHPPRPSDPSITPKSSWPLGMIADSHLETMELSTEILEEVLES